MDIGTFAKEVILSLPNLIEVGIEVESIIENAAEKIRNAQADNRDITDAEWEEVNAEIKALQAERDTATADVDLSGA